MTDLAAGLDPDLFDELVDILTGDDATAAVVAAPGRRRRHCKRTPLHPHCKSVKWAAVYEALRRKGKSKREAAQIANHMHNKWRAGLITRKTFP